MGSITSGVGLVSGINSGQIIDQLIALDSRSVTKLQTRIDNNGRVKLAFTDLQARLSSLLNSSNLLNRPSTFQSAAASVSDTNTLNASVTASAAQGAYQFTVARTVTSQQSVSAGFADADTTPVGAGTIKIGLGGGEVTSSASLSDLNGGAGVRRGSFRITDRSGSSSVIDIGTAVSLDDVIKKINTASNLQIKASLGDTGLVLQDLSGGTGNLKVDDLSGGSAAADLGIKQTVAGDTVTGTAINTVGRSTLLATLNDGLGVRTKPGTDLEIKTADGTTKQISLLNKKTLGEVIDTLNTAGGGKFTVALRADKKGLQITDNTTGGDTLAVTSLSGSGAVKDLGLDGTSAGGVLAGKAVTSNLGSVLLRSLKGGAGVSGGIVSITDRTGATNDIDLSAAESLSDVVAGINKSGLAVSASINKSGTGIQLTDTSGAAGNLQIGDSSGSLAASLGISGNFDASKAVIDGGPLDRQFIGENTRLSDLNGGKGINLGKFRITTGKTVTPTQSNTADVDLSTLTNGTVGDLLNIINAKGIGVAATLNSTGTGILLTDSTGGAVKLKVEDLSGSSARDLNLAGTASANTLDGSYGTTIAVTATDTLNSVITKLNATNAGINASIINDGTGATPFRLSLSATNSGLKGRFTFDAGSTGLAVDPLVKAQNAAVFLGGSGGSGTANPILITSSSNTITNVAPGVTLNLLTASDKPVNVSVTQSSDGAVIQLQGFVKTFNELTSKIKDLTKFDSTTNAKGLLLGDAAASGITDTLFKAINTSVTGAGRYTQFSQIGLTIGADNQLKFDDAKFKSAYAADPTSAQRLFTAFNTVKTTTVTTAGGFESSKDVVTTPFGTDSVGSTTTTDTVTNAKTTIAVKLEGFGLAYVLQKAINKLIDPVDGALIQENKQIDDENKIYSDRITSLNTLLAAKKTRLTKQFADMETVLASLQSQQSAISRISSISSK